jgi:hypothetical protein
MVVAKSIMRHSKDGKALEVRVSKDEQIKGMKEILKRYDPNCKPTDDDVGYLLRAVYRNDYPEFYKNLEKIGSPEKHISDAKGFEDWGIRARLCVFAREIWLHCSEISQQDDFTAQSFDLPRPAEVNLPKKSQSVLLLDDGKEVLTGRLHGGSGMRSNEISAWLNLRLNNGQVLPLMAKSVSVESEGRDLVVIFPSLKDWKISNMVLRGNRLEGSKIEIFHYVGSRWNQLTQEKQEKYEQIFYLAKDKPDGLPNFTLKASVDSITVDDKGSGKLGLSLESKKENNVPLVDAVEITLSNAQVGSVEPSDKVKVEQRKITVNGDMTLTLTLTNLIEGNKVTIRATGKKDGKPSGGSHADIVLDVRKASK